MAEVADLGGLLIACTTDIVSAHVGNNSVAMSDIPAVIRTVHEALAGLGEAAATPRERPEPAVPVRSSITDDHIVCLEDGKKLKLLKRYLATRYGMTPTQYRQRWGLPLDYPMVAPGYAEQRRSLAKQSGLGTRLRPRS
ncbi:MucR family transcriptional regulator [Sphingomonas sp.]|uniref:MucR family transcriptional regulator n=1 Tax=Sphingomonas sp. TaxID=28214 RepID=UPI003B00C526